MTEIEKLANEIGAEFVERIKKRFDEERLNYTGKGKASVSYKVEGNILMIEALERVLFMEFGRRPGKRPPIKPIKAWVEKKLNVSSDESLGVAFAISKKIGEKGTNIFTNRADGLQLEIIMDDLTTEFLQTITNSLSDSVQESLYLSWKKADADFKKLLNLI